MGQSEVKIIISAIDKASGELKKMESSWSQTFKAFGVAAGAVTAVGMAVKKVVDETVAYNKQIREMSQVTGLGAEEISRIVQVGDDWGISIEQLRTGLGYMNKQGVTPSIENLAKLADEYVNSTDKSKFAEKAAKLLGRGYQTLIPLFAKGGDALRAQTAAIDENLIATDKSIKASREYEVAVDNLSDAWQGAKMRVGNDAIPVIADALTRLNQEMDEGITLGGLFGQGVDFWKDTLTGARGKLDEAAAAAAALSIGVGPDMQEQLRGTAGGIEEIGEASENANPPFAAIGETALLASQNFSAARTAASGFAISLGEVTEAEIAAAAMDSLNEALEAGLISLPEYATWAERVGYQILGMDTASMNAQIEMAQLKQQYDSGKISAQEYVTKLQALNTQINNLHDKTIDITINTWYKEYYQRTGTGSNPRAAGGPVAGGASYLVGEKGPELFIPNQSGNIIPNNQLKSGGGGGGDIYATFIINATPNQSPKAIAREALAMLGEAQRYARAGGGIQGV